MTVFAYFRNSLKYKQIKNESLSRLFVNLQLSEFTSSPSSRIFWRSVKRVVVEMHYARVCATELWNGPCFYVNTFNDINIRLACVLILWAYIDLTTNDEGLCDTFSLSWRILLQFIIDTCNSNSSIYSELNLTFKCIMLWNYRSTVSCLSLSFTCIQRNDSMIKYFAIRNSNYMIMLKYFYLRSMFFC